MIEIWRERVCGWEPALRGMRNPMNSWEDADTKFRDEDGELLIPIIGEKDLELASRLANAGPDHGKFLRMITVYLDITAPLYWWKEFDTYKVGTVADSCSTMHKIHAKEFSRNDFSWEHLTPANLDMLDQIVMTLNIARIGYRTSKDKESWWQMIQLLPSSYNQKRTVMLNYQVLRNIYHARKDHKLDEWHEFCGMIERLPYSRELITGKEDP